MENGLFQCYRIFDPKVCNVLSLPWMNGSQTLWGGCISAEMTLRRSREGAGLHWMKSFHVCATQPPTIWATVQVGFVSVIAGSEWLRIPEHSVESPTDACIIISCQGSNIWRTYCLLWAVCYLFLLSIHSPLPRLLLYPIVCHTFSYCVILAAVIPSLHIICFTSS